MSGERMSVAKFNAFFDECKQIRKRMVQAAGGVTVPQMAMAIGIVMAEYANQASADHARKLDEFGKLAFTARDVLELARMNTPQGSVR